MSAQRTVLPPSGAQSQSLIVELSSPPTYWIGFETDGSLGSSREKTLKGADIRTTSQAGIGEAPSVRRGAVAQRTVSRARSGSVGVRCELLERLPRDRQLLLREGDQVLEPRDAVPVGDVLHGVDDLGLVVTVGHASIQTDLRDGTERPPANWGRRVGPPSLWAVSWSHRPALDGLRTVAVYLVVLFHSGIAVVEGGFIGVDLFFVLSGFLVSSILLDELDRTGQLRLGAFYARRVRRLLPAAVVVVVATAAVF